MSGTTIRRAASTSASAFASCRGPAFQTGSAARHSGCDGPRLGKGDERPLAASCLGFVMQPAISAYLKGAVFGFAAVSIWASWGVITRLAVTTSLDAWDIVALRFGVAGLLLSPVLVQRGLARDRLGWLGLAVIIAGTGAPYALVAAAGLRFAPAYDGGALNPGCMPLFVALIAALVLGEKLSTAQKLGLSLILAGALIIVGWHTAAWSPPRTFGDALFLFAAFLTACFTVVMRQAKLDPL